MAEEKKEQAPAVQPAQQSESQAQAGQPGSAPTPAPPSSVVPAETSTAAPATAESPVTKPVDFGGVSYEEVRKGQSPILIKNPDQAMWNDRFTSQYMLVNMTNGRWKPLRPLFVPE